MKSLTDYVSTKIFREMERDAVEFCESGFGDDIVDVMNNLVENCSDKLIKQIIKLLQL